MDSARSLSQLKAVFKDQLIRLEASKLIDARSRNTCCLSRTCAVMRVHPFSRALTTLKQPISPPLIPDCQLQEKNPTS